MISLIKNPLRNNTALAINNMQVFLRKPYADGGFLIHEPMDEHNKVWLFAFLFFGMIVEL